MRRIRSYSGAGVLLFRYNRNDGRFEVLLGKRSIRHGYGKWAIPGGGMEKIDSGFAACAYRELREETGIDINGLKARDLSEIKTDIPFFHWRTYLVMTWGDFTEFRIREFSELRWIPVSDIGKYDLWISLNREIRAFRKILEREPLDK